MGDSFVPMNVVFDTGSDWLLIQGELCELCVGAKYNSMKDYIIERK